MVKQKKKRRKKDKVSNEQIRKLKVLKESVDILESKFQEAKKEKNKQFHIRNLKVFYSISKFTAPFVVCSGITVGLFALFGGGTPFHVDKITKYKTYTMDYQTNGYININEEYRTNRLIDDQLPSNSLIVYTPWKLQDGQYIRVKREYDIGELTTLDLYKAVLENDYDYIIDNLKNYDEEKQVINKVNISENNNYEMKASLHIRDDNDVLKYNESMTKNIIITLIELVLGLGVGSLIAYFRDFSIFFDVREINYDYHGYTSLLKNTQIELEITKKKVLALTKSIGGKSHEK